MRLGYVPRHAAQADHRHAPRVAGVIATGTVMSLLFAGVASADTLQNDVTSGSDSVRTTVSGGSGLVATYSVQKNGATCDVAGLSVTVNHAAAVNVATSPVTFTGCSPAETEVTFTSSTPGSYNITHSISDATPGDGYTNHADFTLLVVPRPPSGVTATGGLGQVQVSWSASPDSAIDGYHVYRGGALKATTTGLTATDSGLAESTEYCYTVKAYKGALESAGTTPVCATTSSSDSTAPDSGSISIDDGADWTNSSTGTVSVDISAHDAVGVTGYRLAETSLGLDSATTVPVSPAQVNFSASDLAFTLTGLEASTKSVYVRFFDAAGNTSDANDGIGWDYTAPSITNGTATGTSGLAGWYTSAVTNPFNVSDNLSGLDATCQTDFPSGTKSVSTGTQKGAGVTVSSGACSDAAGNTNNGISSPAFDIDLDDPTATISSPADGLVTIATSITVSGTADDPTPGSGLAGVTVNGAAASGLANFSKTGVALNCGSNTITAVATDVAGRTGSHQISVTRLCFGLQFSSPIDPTTTTPVVNTGKYGRVIPVKVKVNRSGTNQSATDLTNLGLTLQMGVNGATCLTGSTTDDLEAYADAGSSNMGTNLFRWDTAAGQWIYNLDTKAAPGMTMTVGQCYRLDVYVSDGTNKVKISNSPYALFKPTK